MLVLNTLVAGCSGSQLYCFFITDFVMFARCYVAVIAVLIVYVVLSDGVEVRFPANWVRTAAKSRFTFKGIFVDRLVPGLACRPARFGLKAFKTYFYCWRVFPSEERDFISWIYFLREDSSLQFWATNETLTATPGPCNAVALQVHHRKLYHGVNGKFPPMPYLPWKQLDGNITRYCVTVDGGLNSLCSLDSTIFEMPFRWIHHVWANWRVPWSCKLTTPASHWIDFWRHKQVKSVIVPKLPHCMELNVFVGKVRPRYRMCRRVKHIDWLTTEDRIRWHLRYGPKGTFKLKYVVNQTYISSWKSGSLHV